MTISTPSPLLNRLEATPVISPLCQKPPSPMIAIGRFCHVRCHCRGARKRHAVAEDGIAQRERRESRKRMAADVGADVGRAQFALHQLDRGEHRTLRAAGAEGRRARRQGPESGGGFLPCARSGRAPFSAMVSASMPFGFGLLQERSQTFQQAHRRYIRPPAAAALAEHARVDVGAAQLDVHRLLDVVGIAFFDDQHRALACAERRAAPPAPTDRPH